MTAGILICRPLGVEVFLGKIFEPLKIVPQRNQSLLDKGNFFCFNSSDFPLN